MKVLFIGDHRDSLNWGGRGQSIALYQLIKNRFDISGVITGNSVLSVEENDGYIRTLMPIRFIRFFYRVRNKSRLIDWYLKIEEALGAKDFITDDPTRSADYLLRYKSKAPGLSQIYDLVKNSDLLIINGEGSGIFRTPFRRDFLFYLTMIELGVRLGKKVFYVNGIISDCPKTGRNNKVFNSARSTLSKCCSVLVRDQESYELVKREMPEVNCQYVPDALFTWFEVYERYGSSLPVNGDFVIAAPEKDDYLGKLDFSKPYICIGGSASAADDQEKSVIQFTRLVDRVKELGFPLYLAQSCGGDRFLQHVARICDVGIVPVNTPIFMCGAILANARLFISGRFHASIFASLGGTPCIFLDTHSHKIRSLQKTLEYDYKRIFSTYPSNEEIIDILSVGRDYISQEEQLRSRIKQIVGKRCEEAKQLPDHIKNSL